MTRSYEPVVVIGASAGGVHALLQIAERLPRFFPAPVCIVQHIGSNPSLLPELLRFRGPNPAMHAEDGQRLTAGTLHVAPPDRHMLLEGDRLRLTHGPKENHARPAIDPLFRSAALSHGPAVVGVVLTGQMDDGTAGLKAVKDCGGTVVVQDPASAEAPEMPRSALRNVAVDHCVALDEIPSLLVRLVQGSAHAAGRRCRSSWCAKSPSTGERPPWTTSGRSARLPPSPAPTAAAACGRSTRRSRCATAATRATPTAR